MLLSQRDAIRGMNTAGRKRNSKCGKIYTFSCPFELKWIADALQDQRRLSTIIQAALRNEAENRKDDYIRSIRIDQVTA